ncbi:MULTISPECIES: recombination protein NinB [Snodgrassella]|uniref:recombination protein NinB n=1 Tax=Snodgrassella TaxID=1193515 RepID=UPI0008161C77|nr:MULTISPECIES: recombination protein NinB [Snodgrassella]SCC08995.1 NinB protein [Snodgrassella sp. R-53583]
MTERFKRKINKKNKRDVMTLAWDFVGTLLNTHDDIFIEVRSVTRSDEQNAKLHAMLGDIAKQKTFNGKKLSIEQWKMIFVSGHRIATGGQAEMAIGLEGEVINLRESTAQMGVKRMASLIEYITAWGVENDVKFTDWKKYDIYNRFN